MSTQGLHIIVYLSIGTPKCVQAQMTAWLGRRKRSPGEGSGHLGSTSWVGVLALNMAAQASYLAGYERTWCAGAGGNLRREDSPLLLKAYVVCDILVAGTVWLSPSGVAPPSRTLAHERIVLLQA